MRRLKVNFSDFWPGLTIRRNPFFVLLSKRYDLEISEKPDYLFYAECGWDYRAYDCVRIFCTAENVRPDFSQCDYAFCFDYPITRRNYRMPSYRWMCDHYNKLKLPRDADALMATKDKFCNFIYSNPRPAARNFFFERLSAYKRVDSAGRFRNNVGHFLEGERKIDFMSAYKFSIIFENTSYPGYTTEKIHDAMVANTIPIYWGNPLIGLDFNPRSFINCHDFNNFDEVVERIAEMDQSEELYKTCLSEPPLRDNRDLDYLTEDAIFARFERIFATREIIRNVAPSRHLLFSNYQKPASMRQKLRRRLSRCKYLLLKSLRKR